MLDQLISVIWNLPPLVYVFIALATVWYWMSRSRLPDNVPPFPCKPHFWAGHENMMKSGPLEKCHEWRQSTGDVFSIYMGQRYFVVLNSLKTIKEAFVKQADAFSHRYVEVSIRNAHETGLYGIFSSSGPNWKEQRTVSMSILRSFGMGKNFLAEKISLEVEAYLKALNDLKGKPTNLHILTNASVSNVICAILIGNRFECDDPKFVHMIKIMSDMIRTRASVLLESFPWLRHLPGDFFKAKRMQKNLKAFYQFSDNFITDFQVNEHDNFIKAYQKEQEKRESSTQHTYLSEKNLRSIVGNLFIAGTETTSTTLLWAMLFVIHYPDTQEKVYQEILEVVGSDRLPSIQDKPRLNYTNAFIMETQRLGNVVPLGVPHLCIADSKVAGYTIPKGTVVLSNLDQVLTDKDTWGDPLVFRPSRFLDKDDNLLVPEEFIPFGIGRRYCMGESLAKMELFLFITGIFQRFHIMPEDPDNLPPIESFFGFTRGPKPFKPRLVERKTD